MPLDAAGRKKRARKAAQVLAKKRREETQGRNQNIVLAFARLTGARQNKSDTIRAIQFLTELGCGVNLPEGVMPLRFLAEATGLTRQRIWQILSSASKASSRKNTSEH